MYHIICVTEDIQNCLTALNPFHMNYSLWERICLE